VLQDDPTGTTYSVNREETSTTESAGITPRSPAPVATATGVGPGGSRENLDDDSADSEVSATSGVGQNPLSGGTTSSDTSTPGSGFGAAASSTGSPDTLQSPEIDQQAIDEAR
jgi:hypothetical protein